MSRQRSDRHRVVVVGVDGGPDSVAALTLAVDEARRRNGVVEMVTVWQPGQVADVGNTREAVREARRRAVRRQSEAIATCERSGGVPVTGVVVEGDPSDMLGLAAHGAACLVLGRGPARGGVRRACSRTVDCPVIVVVDDEARSGAMACSQGRGVPTDRELPGRRRPSYLHGHGPSPA